MAVGLVRVLGGLATGVVLVVALVTTAPAGAQEAGAPVAGPEQAAPAPSLRLAELRVTPRFARPGSVVRIEATVANEGAVPVLDVRLAPAVTGGMTGTDRWEIVDESEAGPVPELMAGGTATLAAEVRLQDEGAPKVGAGIVAAGGVIVLPRGEVVRIARPSSLAAQVGLLAVAFTVIVGGGAALLRGAGPPRSAVPRWSLVGAGVGVVLLGVVGWSLAEPLDEQIANLGLTMFVGGWVAAFTGLRPRRSWSWGAALGIGGYVGIGLGWALIRSVGLERLPVHAALRAEAMAGTWLWPLDLAQLVGLAVPAGPV